MLPKAFRNAQLMIFIPALVGLFIAAPSPALSHQAKKPTPKPKAAPPQKPAPAQPSTGVKAATELAGDNGRLSVPYMIGNKDDELVITLRSVEYTTRPVQVTNVSDEAIPKADEKLLVLHYSVQNPQKKDMDFYWESLVFTGVDSKDVNHLSTWVARDGTPDSVNLQLKPAQKLDVFTALVVPAAGPVPKLIVQRGTGRVLRYDLRDKAKPLTPPVADPKDTTGTTALLEVPGGAVGTYYTTGPFDIRVDGVTFLTKQPNGEDAEEGKRYAVVAVTFKNLINRPAEISASTFKGELATTDGEKIENQLFLKMSSADSPNETLRPGEEGKARFIFTLPTAAGAKSIRLQEGENSRAFVINVAAK